MPQYKFTGSNPVSIPALGLELRPGEKFETEEALNHSHFELIKPKRPKADKPKPDKSRAAVKAPAKEA